jgi:Domain of unknown function (DUF6249)
MEWTQFVIAIVGILASFCVPVILVAIILYYKHRRNALNHETIARLSEKGLPVPTQLLDPPQAHSSLRGGLVLVALGVALGFYFWDRGMPWSIGLIPGLMGAALLIAWGIEEQAVKRRDATTP